MEKTTAKATQKAQILITTVLTLMIISLTIVVIAAAVARNNRQVFNNLEYQRSYNYAETRVISAASVLSDPSYDLEELPAVAERRADIDADNCETLTPPGFASPRYYCRFNEEQGERVTLMTIEDKNEVIAFDLSSEQYFDIRLIDGSTTGYRRPVTIEWNADTSLELNLIYQKTSGELGQEQEILDPLNLYRGSKRLGSGFLLTPPIVTDNRVTIDLGNLDTNKVGTNEQLMYLRVRVLNDQVGTALTIKPENTDPNFPKQIRELEAFSYLLTDVETSAPVVETQLPLSPPVPLPLTQALTFNSLRQPVCGNGIIEGAESCDDGNASNNDDCPATCLVCQALADTTPRDICNIAVVREPSFSEYEDMRFYQARVISFAQSVNNSVVSIETMSSDFSNFDVVAYVAMNNTDATPQFRRDSTPAQKQNMLNHLYNGKDMFIITDHGGFHGGVNYILQDIGVSVVGRLNLNGTFPAQETDYTRDVFKGMEMMTHISPARTVELNETAKERGICGRCQYEYNGNCMWYEVYFPEGNTLNIITSIGPTVSGDAIGRALKGICRTS
ncbi:MAG: hypothetical protein ACOCXP_00590 [Candidatus Dojkabacteria bacterium]